MVIDRRRSLVLLGLLGASVGAAGALPASAAAPPPPPHPILWLVERNGAKVWIFGEADTRDQSWLTPHIRRAFDESDEIWFEAPKPDPSAKVDSEQKQSDDLDRTLGYDMEHSLFDQLDPKLSVRLLAAANTYGVPRADLEHARPWMAYFVLNHGYWAHRMKQGLGGVADAPDAVFAQMAWAAGKTVRSENPTAVKITHFFADMTPEQQRERLEFLLDFYDDEARGHRADQYDWLVGKASSVNIDRMRIAYPALYQAEHVKRNIWWADQVAQMLAAGAVHFIVIGLNHMLGPDSILVRLRERGFVAVGT